MPRQRKQPNPGSVSAMGTLHLTLPQQKGHTPSRHVTFPNFMNLLKNSVLVIPQTF